ncbi:MAG: cyclase dehydrase [Casimicrobiaceae bacterium]
MQNDPLEQDPLQPEGPQTGTRTAREATVGDGLPSAATAGIQQPDEEMLARALGWFSVALGLAEVVAPRQVGRAIGVESHPNLLRAVGLREIASGVGILSGQPRSGWLWSRVAGDAVNLALLGAALSSPEGKRGRLAAATAAVASVTALDVYCSARQRREDSSAATTGDASAPAEVIELRPRAERG